MSETRIRYALEGDIAVIAMNDPATLNAAGLELVEEFLAAMERAAREARCVIITGDGRGFCSGANLSGGSPSDPASFDAGAPLDSHYNPLMSAIKEHPTPVVTAVNGPAAGIGCSIGLAGDIILASETAYFLQAFGRIGLVPDGGSTWLLARTIGRARAMEMAMLAEKLPAKTALEWGLINRVCASDQLMPEAMAMARRLAEGPKALAITRRLIWKACDASFEEVLHEERVAQRTAGRTADFSEGVEAFLGKRPAAFKGR